MFFSLHSVNDSNTQILHLVLVFTSLKGLLKTCRRYRKRATGIISAEKIPDSGLMWTGWGVSSFFFPLHLSYL